MLMMERTRRPRRQVMIETGRAPPARAFSLPASAREVVCTRCSAGGWLLTALCRRRSARCLRRRSPDNHCLRLPS